MKERPIPFNTGLIPKILDNSKTQTRRVIKNPNRLPIAIFESSQYAEAICPYGQVGDRLWVKETWRIESFMEGEPILFGYKDGQRMEENECNDTVAYENWYERICIQSAEDAKKAFSKGLVRQDEQDYYRWDIGKTPCRWRSPLHMPRWASRIILEITEVRVERVQEITRVGIKQEGIKLSRGSAMWAFYEENLRRFVHLWDSLNAKYPWESNPWVWVISFRRLSQPS